MGHYTVHVEVVIEDAARTRAPYAVWHVRRNGVPARDSTPIEGDVNGTLAGELGIAAALAVAADRGEALAREEIEIWIQRVHVERRGDVIGYRREPRARKATS